MQIQPPYTITQQSLSLWINEYRDKTNDRIAQNNT